MIYSTVKGLKFTRFRVFGEHIPSVKSIEDVMRDRPNEAARVYFQTLSNHICEIYDQECKNEYPPDLPENEQARNKIDLFREEWGRTEAICKQIKYDFCQLIISRYIVFWYDFVAGNMSGGNPQTAIRKNKPTKGYTEPILRLRKYPDFSRAEDYRIRFRELVNFEMSTRAESYLNGSGELVDSVMSADDVIFFKLQSDMKNIYIDLAKIEEKRRRKAKASSFYCEYCQSYHTFDNLKVRSTCGSPECGKAHDTDRRLIVDRVETRKGWIHDPIVNPKLCVCCASWQKRLNNDRLCLKCYIDIAFLIEFFAV